MGFSARAKFHKNKNSLGGSIFLRVQKTQFSTNPLCTTLLLFNMMPRKNKKKTKGYGRGKAGKGKPSSKACTGEVARLKHLLGRIQPQEDDNSLSYSSGGGEEKTAKPKKRGVASTVKHGVNEGVHILKTFGSQAEEAFGMIHKNAGKVEETLQYCPEMMREWKQLLKEGQEVIKEIKEKQNEVEEKVTAEIPTWKANFQLALYAGGAFVGVVALAGSLSGLASSLMSLHTILQVSSAGSGFVANCCSTGSVGCQLGQAVLYSATTAMSVIGTWWCGNKALNMREVLKNLKESSEEAQIAAQKKEQDEKDLREANQKALKELVDVATETLAELESSDNAFHCNPTLANLNRYIESVLANGPKYHKIKERLGKALEQPM